MWASTRQTGLTAERLLLALRVRIFSHLQRLSVDYYDRELGGRVMTRMTTDVEALSSLLQTGLIQAVVSFFTFVGVLIVLGVVNWQLTLAVMVVVPPLFAATWAFRVRSAQCVRPGAGAHRGGQRRPPGEPLRGAGRAGVVPRAGQLGRLPPAVRRLPRRPPRRAAAGRPLLPVRLLPVDGRPGRGARGGEPDGVRRDAHRRRAHRLHPLPRPVLLAGPAALAGVRHLPAGVGVDAAHQRADGHAHLDAGAGPAGPAARPPHRSGAVRGRALRLPRRQRRGPAGHRPRSRTRRGAGPRRRDRCRQVDDRQADRPLPRPDFGPGAGRRRRR